MPNHITCPNCNHQFDVEDVLAADIEKKYKSQYQQQIQEETGKLAAERTKLQALEQEFEEKRKKENEIFTERLANAKEKIEKENKEQQEKLQEELKASLKKSINADYEQQMSALKETMADNEEKLKLARKESVDFLKQKEALKQKEEELELVLQRKLSEERQELKAQIQKQEEEKNTLKEQEFKLKLQEERTKSESQLKLIEELKKKAEQGSMQLQGEAQELLLEKELRENFPFDSIEEVGKGVTGADCIQVVRNHLGMTCGKIIYESKRAKNWNNDWVEKLKTDMRDKNCDVAILVTEVFPRDMIKFGEQQGIWICGFVDAMSVAKIIRSGIMNVYDAQQSQVGRADKMHLLYEYMTGVEFRGQVEAIVEGFSAMKQGIDKERMQMQKIWKEREKQLEKVMMNTVGLYGSVKGIAGAAIGDIPLLEGDTEDFDLLEE